MTEISLLWETVSGVGDSDTSGHDDSQMFQLWRSFFSRTANLGGVSPDFQNELAVTGTATPVSVNTGAALVYGVPYFNSAAVTVAIPTPASLTRIDRIVLRASWAARTVRITRIAGTEGGAAPAMVQTPGTTWDIPLANVSITTGAVITVTDAREWLIAVGDGTIDSTKLAAGAVTTAKIVDDAVTYAKMQNISVSQRILGRNSANAGDFEELTAAMVLTMLGLETGTFNPTWLVGQNESGVTYTSRSGDWFKIGNILFITASLTLSNKGLNNSQITIGIPYTILSTKGHFSVRWAATATNFVNVVGTPSGLSSIALKCLTAAGSSFLTDLFNSDCTNTTEIRLSGIAVI